MGSAWANTIGAVSGLSDAEGHSVDVSPSGTMLVSTTYKLAGKTFGASTDPNYWTMSNSGAGSAAGTANALTTLSSGTANSGYGQMVSVQTARLISTVPNSWYSAHRVTVVAVAGCTRTWGAGNLSGQTPQNAAYFSLSPAGVLSVVTASGGVATPVASGSWNGVRSSFTLDTNVHVYQIIYWLTSITFYIDGVAVHTVTPTTTPMAQSWGWQAFAQSVNSASGTTSGTLEIWQSTIVRLGEADSAPTWKNVHGAVTAAVAKNTPGRLRRVIINDGTSAATVTLYDALTATNPIATVAWQNNSAPVTLDYDLEFYVGLTYTTTGAGTDVTLVFE